MVFGCYTRQSFVTKVFEKTGMNYAYPCEAKNLSHRSIESLVFFAMKQPHSPRRSMVNPLAADGSCERTSRNQRHFKKSTSANCSCEKSKDGANT